MIESYRVTDWRVLIIEIVLGVYEFGVFTTYEMKY